MGIRTRGVAALAVAVIGMVLALLPAGSAAAADYVFPSTNDFNRANGLPHVNELSKGLGTVTLEFVNPTNSLAFFEYRLDSQTVGTTPHPIVTGDVIHPGVCVDGRTPPACAPGPVTRTFTANTLVEIRLALGGERDWDFDWTPFTVGQPYVFPSTNDFNRANGLPHVNELSKGVGTVTLEFVNTTNSLAFFEYRIDSQTVGTDPHPIVTGDVVHPGVCVDGRTPPACAPGPVTQTFTANTLVEIRLALGGERDWDFDWTPFTVGQPYVFPSTNDFNRANGLPHVNELSKGLGTVTLEFVNPTNSLAFFEYRIDSQTVGTDPHPIVIGDVVHPGVCVDGRTPPACAPGPVTRTFTANTLVEIRLALGGERDWDFDWTPFTVGPASKDDCKRGGWEAFGFRNQGQCIKFVKNAGDKPYDDHEEDKGDKDRDDRDDRKDRDEREDREDRKDRDERDDRKDRDDGEDRDDRDDREGPRRPRDGPRGPEGS